MRKNSIGFLRILTLLFIFTLCGCSEEIYENELKPNPKFKVEIVNSNALTKNKELMKSLSINKVIRPSQTSRIIRDTINGFSIDTDNVKYLEGSDFNSYTFNILNQESEEMDNLVLMSQPDGSYKPYIMRYELTTAEKEALNEGKNIDFTNKTKVIILHDSNLISDFFSRISYMEVCTMTYTWEEQVTIIPCKEDYCLIEPWASYTVSYVLVGTSTCSGGGGGGGSIVASGDSGGYIGTAPHPGGGGTRPVVPSSPCDKIKTLLTNANFTEKQEELKKKTGLKVETGYSQNKDGTFTALTSRGSTATADKMNLVITPNMVGYLHTHLDDYETGELNSEGESLIRQPIRMFSPADVGAFLELVKNAQANNTSIDAVYGGMVSSQGTYQLRFTGDVSKIDSNFKWDDDSLTKAYKSYFENYKNKEMAFIKFLDEKCNIKGIELYKINKDQTSTKKALDTNNKIKDINC